MRYKDKWGKGQFKGDIKGGHPQGVGKMMYSNGDRYHGSWHKGKKEGNGVMRYNKGEEQTLLEGTWKNDQMKDGRGLLAIKNNPSDTGEYIGQIKNGARDGKGIMLYEDQVGKLSGKKYNGTWSQGKRDGFGSLTNDGILVYKGTWKNDNEVLGKG